MLKTLAGSVQMTNRSHANGHGYKEQILFGFCVSPSNALALFHPCRIMDTSFELTPGLVV